VAETENVSRTVVREAVARLAAQGLITSRQGSGVYVAETAQYKPFQVTRDELAELADIIKLLEMRLALETEMAGLAAARRTTADIGAIRSALFDMENTFNDPQAAARADSAFHLAIARATQNHYYERLIDFLGVRLVPRATCICAMRPRRRTGPMPKRCAPSMRIWSMRSSAWMSPAPATPRATTCRKA
jgi:DNA-binding FadR family transcriptional regulator